MDLKLTVIICFTGIVCLSILTFGVIGAIAFKRAQRGAAKSFGLMFQRGNFLRIATVVLVVVAVVFLALLDVIEENGVIGILGGVAGYVLGGLERGKREDQEDEAND